jgi:cholesterol oxidase
MPARLSLPIGRLRSEYHVVVIGSGYGGAIAASRMARTGLRVCVLERGREFALGEFPSTAFRGFREIQYNMPTGRKGRPLALFEIHANEDVNAVVGCGLGGTSLINAGVALKPDRRVWNDARWPTAIRGDLRSVAAGYCRARQMLSPRRLPTGFGALRKLSALHASATVLDWGSKFYRPPINVTFEDRVNRAGVRQKGCTACGDCVSGCNDGSKNTTTMNYLPDAVNHGAAIFTQVEARSIQRGQGKWIVNYQLVDVGREVFGGPELRVSADLVVVSAGAIGSTAILLRSKRRGLPMSARVGERFTGNGDVLAFAYNTDHPIYGIGFGSRPKGRVPDVGPCITGIIDTRDTNELEEGFVIEEGAFPGALGLFLPYVLAWSDILVGKTVRIRDRAKAWPRIFKSWILGAYRGATRNTQIYLVMAHDNEKGKVELENDLPRILWPGAGSEPIFQRINSTLRRATKALGGDFVENPLWSKLLGRQLVTVHALGGCPMGDRADSAVVDHKGSVFLSSRGDAVHKGLHVIDGAILPMSLGVNPLLTISALAERCCALIATDRGLAIDYSFTPLVDRPEPDTGLRFTERMRGFLSPDVDADFSELAKRGPKAGDAQIEFTLTVASEDLRTMLRGEAHEAAIIGTLTCSALSPRPMTIAGGRFNLFVKKARDPGVRLMIYDAPLRGAYGETFHLHGEKVIAPGPPVNAWRDTTTLRTTIFRDGPDGRAIVGRGILRISLADFLRQLKTIEVTDAPSTGKRFAAMLDYFRFFVGTLFATYINVFSALRNR